MTDVGRRRGATFATLIALIALASLAAALAGCAVGPNYAQPATPVTPQFEAAAMRRQISGRSSAIRPSIG